MNKVVRRSDTEADEFLGAKLGQPLSIMHSKIDPNPDQPRERDRLDPESLRLLSLDIEENDQSTPVVVFKRSEPEHRGRYMLVGGERRWTSIGMIVARRQKDWPVKAFIISIKDANHLFEKSFLDNTGRANYSVLEEARGCERLRNRNGWTLERIATVMQKSVGWVEDRIQLNSLPDEVKDLMYLSTKEGGLPISVAITLSYMPKSQNADKIEIAREVVGRGLRGPESQLLITMKTGVSYARQTKRGNKDKVWKQYRMFARFLDAAGKSTEWLSRFGDIDELYLESDDAIPRKGSDAKHLREIIERLTATYLLMNVEPERLINNLNKVFEKHAKADAKKK